MIEITKEQEDAIKIIVKGYGGDKDLALQNHAVVIINDSYEYDFISLSDISIGDMAKILYVDGSYKVSESIDDKKKRWKYNMIDYEHQDLVKDYYGHDIYEILSEFAKDFSIKLD